MKLNDSPFNSIKSGSKTIELRLYDEKRRKLDVGDSIIFSNLSNNNEKIAVCIKALYRYASFRDLFSELPLEQCGISSSNSIDDAVNEMRKYYSEKDETIYGVLGIRIQIVDLQSVLEEQKQIEENIYNRYFPDEMK